MDTLSANECFRFRGKCWVAAKHEGTVAQVH